jgi:prepilin-type N-terminal cleavage/methylation domain-containing protein
MKNHTSIPSRQAGFSMVELSLVLVVIAIIIGAVTMGADLQRNATYQKISTGFVRGWQLSYLSHTEKINVVPGDSQTSPTGFVNQNDGSELCETGLRNAMYAAGVEMPTGRGEGRETHFGYLDSNGNPQDVEVCFKAIAWSVPGATAGTYVTQTKNVMIIKRVTPDLARMIDGMIDGVPDAQFGKIRQLPLVTTATSKEWDRNNTYAYGGGATNLDESQVDVVTVYYLLN